MGFISEKIVKTRKDQTCRVCGETLPKGGDFVAYKGVEKETGFYTVYFHQECRKYSLDWDEDDWDYANPGVVSRQEVLENSKMNCCENKQIKDLSQGLGNERHWYCSRCQAHIWKGKFYTAKEWDAWVNS